MINRKNSLLFEHKADQFQVKRRSDWVKEMKLKKLE